MPRPRPGATPRRAFSRRAPPPLYCPSPARAAVMPPSPSSMAVFPSEDEDEAQTMDKGCCLDPGTSAWCFFPFRKWCARRVCSGCWRCGPACSGLVRSLWSEKIFPGTRYSSAPACSRLHTHTHTYAQNLCVHLSGGVARSGIGAIDRRRCATACCH